MLCYTILYHVYTDLSTSVYEAKEATTTSREDKREVTGASKLMACLPILCVPPFCVKVLIVCVLFCMYVCCFCYRPLSCKT